MQHLQKTGGGAIMRIRFFQTVSLGIALAASLAAGVFAMPQAAGASERAGQAPPLQKRGSGGEEDKQAPPLQKPGSGGEEDKQALPLQKRGSGGEEDKQAPPVQKPGSGGEERKLVGTWRGDSLCVEKGTACHDEVAVYRIAALPDKPGYVTVTGGRVVDGKEIVMGTGEGRYDSAKHTLTVELPRGVITLKADGDKLEGTYTLLDKNILRRITLKKSE